MAPRVYCDGLDQTICLFAWGAAELPPSGTSGPTPPPLPPLASLAPSCSARTIAGGFGNPPRVPMTVRSAFDRRLGRGSVGRRGFGRRGHAFARLRVRVTQDLARGLARGLDL